MRRLLPLAPLLLAACHRAEDVPVVRHAWVRLAAVPGQPAAGYFELAGGRTATRLLRVESALAGRIELHASMAGMDGMTHMAPLAGVDVPAGGAVPFAPGGRHVMVYGLERVVVPGTAVPLRFGFADGRTAEAEAKTVGAGDAAPY